jgi:hypothetical protein
MHVVRMDGELELAKDHLHIGIGSTEPSSFAVLDLVSSIFRWKRTRNLA